MASQGNTVSSRATVAPSSPSLNGPTSNTVQSNTPNQATRSPSPSVPAPSAATTPVRAVPATPQTHSNTSANQRSRPANTPSTTRPQLSNSNTNRRPRSKRPILKLVLSLVDDWWLLEICSALFSISCLLCICILLAVYNGRPVPDFRWGITLNAVVALLTTLMKGALLTLLTEGTSQLKWLAFAGPNKRPLSELDVYDGASRGGWGSVMILWRHKKWLWRDICSLAAVFTIAAISIDTFTQQLIQNQFITKSVASDDVVVARSTRYENWTAAVSGTADGVPYLMGPDMTAALYGGLYSTNMFTADLSRCASANCSYPIVPSIAVCSKCTNITSHLVSGVTADNYTTLSLPGGPQVYYGPESTSLINSTSTNNASATLNLQNITSLLTAFSYINVTDLGTRAEAAECALYICVQAFNTTVESGIMSQEVVRTWTEVTNEYVPLVADWDHLRHEQPGNSSYNDLLNLESKIPDLEMSIPQDPVYNRIGGSFNVTAGAYWGLTRSLPHYFQGDCVWDYIDPDTRLRSPPICSSDDVSRLYYAQPNMSALVDLVARSMTSGIRRSSAFQASSGYTGTADTMVPVVYIQWSWISLPAAVVLFANLFLLYAILRNSTVSKHSNIGVWKSSQMPMLYHGLDTNALASLQGANTHTSYLSAGAMQDHAETMRVSFRTAADGLRLRT